MGYTVDEPMPVMIVSGGSGGGGGAVTIADGADVALGARADAPAAAYNSTATLMAKVSRLVGIAEGAVASAPAGVTVSDGAAETIGAKADAVAAAYNSTASLMAKITRLVGIAEGAIATAPSVIAGGDGTTGASVTNPVPVDWEGREYETVAASATNQALGATGAIGDTLEGLWVVPTTTAPGAISVKDGSDAAMEVFAGGTIASVIGWWINYPLKSRTGAIQITTGANVKVTAFGKFT